MQLSDREIQNTIDLLKEGRHKKSKRRDRKSIEAELEEVEKVVREIGEVPPVRQERVEKVKRAIESSSYDVTSEEVAKKLIGRVISDQLE